MRTFVPRRCSPRVIVFLLVLAMMPALIRWQPAANAEPTEPSGGAATTRADSPTSPELVPDSTPEPDLTPEQGRPDRASATAAARQSGQRVEVEGLRKPTSLTFARPDGTFEDEIAAGPERVLVVEDKTDGPEGTWKPIDPNLELGPDGARPRVIAADVRFSSGGSDQLAHIGVRGTNAAVDLSLSNVKLPAPVIERDTITYKNISPGIDLVFKAQPAGFSKRLVVHQRPTSAPVWRFPLAVAGLTATQTPSGGLEFKDAQGQTLIYGDSAWMWGAERDPQADEPTRIGTVATTLLDTKQGQVLEVRPDFNFLSDPTVSYPITVDPSLSLTATADTFVQSNIRVTSQWTNAELKSGTYDGSTVARSLVRFDTSGIVGKEILNSTLRLWEFHSWSCSAREVRAHRLDGPFDSATVWDNQPPYFGVIEGSANVAVGYSSSCPDNWIDIPIVNALVQAWADQTVANHGFLIRAANEGDVYGWKKFNSLDAASNRPLFIINYNTRPDVPTLQSPANGAKVAACTPTLSAWYYDADGNTGGVDFRILDSAGNNVSGGSGWIWSGYGASGRSASVVTPCLAAGTYSWQTRAWDGNHWSEPQWRDSRTFVINVRPNVGTMDSPADGATLDTAKAVVSGTYSDPDGDQGGLDFEVHDSAGGDVTGNPNGFVWSGYGSTPRSVSYTTPWLPDGTYTWRVRAWDGFNWSSPNWSPQRTFTISTPCPIAGSEISAEEVVARRLTERCNLVDVIVADYGVSLAVPPPDIAVFADALRTDGSQQLAAETSASGTTTLSYVGQEPIITDGAPGSPPGCQDDAFTLLDVKVTSDFGYRFNASTTPTQLFSPDVARQVIVSGASNITTARNDCTRPDFVEAPPAINLGDTTRRSDIVDGRCKSWILTDGENVMDFGSLAPDTLGLACIWAFPQIGPNPVLQADVSYNSDPVEAPWAINPPTVCPGQYDLESVVTHEWGHVYGLGHVSGLTNANLTMSDLARPCDTSKQTLGLGDMLGLESRY